MGGVNETTTQVLTKLTKYKHSLHTIQIGNKSGHINMYESFYHLLPVASRIPKS